MGNRSILTLGLACLLTLFGCGTSAPPMPPKPPLQVGWFLWNGWYPMAIAQELKLFEKHGVAVKPILYTNYTEILPDLSSGRLDAGFSGMYEVLKSNLPDLRIALVTDHSDGAEGLVVLPSVQGPKDLKGKRIGVQGALSGSEFLITTFLRTHGLSSKDLTLVSVPPESVLERMPAQIHGGYTWDPFLAQARQKGYRTLFTTADMPGLIVDVVAFQGRVAQERPEDIRRFNAAWFEAVEYWKAHPQEATAMIVKVTGLKPEEITSAGCRLFTRQDNQDTFRNADDYRSVRFTARKQVEFFISVGDASTPPDLDRILTSDFLN